MADAIASHGTNANGSVSDRARLVHARSAWLGRRRTRRIAKRSAGPALGRFYPSPPERAKTLSSEQVRRFNADGFVRPLDALTFKAMNLPIDK